MYWRCGINRGISRPQFLYYDALVSQATDEFTVLRNWKCDPYGYLVDIAGGGYADGT